MFLSMRCVSQWFIKLTIALLVLTFIVTGLGCGTSTESFTETPVDPTIRDYEATFETSQRLIDAAIQTRTASPVASPSPEVTVVSEELDTDIGFRDFTYGATDVTRPTGSKTNFPVWYNDGFWWASLFSSQADSFHIHRLDTETQQWIDTGTLVDSRNSSTADVISNGSTLFIATVASSARSATDRVYFTRYAYNPTNQMYEAEPGFPVTLTMYGLASLSLAEDAFGTLWLAYVHESIVWVTSSIDDGTTWQEPAPLDVAGTQVSPEDVAVVFAYDDRIGIAWSNQLEGAFYVTSHTAGDPAGRWRVTQILMRDVGIADNHLSVTTLAEDDPAGKVFIAAKTSKDVVDTPDPDSPLILLFVLGQDGLWRSTVVSRVSDNHTRPSIVIDAVGRRALIFATAPNYGGAIYVKASALDELRFSSGPGSPVLRNRLDKRINNAAISRQAVTRESGLVIVGSDMDTRMYLHNYFPGDQLGDLSN